MLKMVTNVVNEKQLRQAQLRALKLFADSVKCTYGPMGGYTAYSKQDPNQKLKGIVSYYTKDGFTVLKNLDTDKPIESLLKDDIRTICTQVIKSIGDGTTSATMLSYYIFKGLLDLQNEGLPKRQIIKAFKKIIKDGIDWINQRAREATVDDIYNIALTSLNGNEEMANTIKNIYEESGMNVFIDVAESNTPNTVVKTYNSMIYEAGYIDPCFINNEKEKTCDLDRCHVYVFESPIDTPDMIMDLKLIFEKEVTEPIQRYNTQVSAGKKNPNISLHPVVVICPQISRDANSYIDQLINSFTNMTIAQKPRFCIVSNIDNDNGYLLDIMKLTGAKFIKKYIDKDTYEEDKKQGLAPTEKTITSFCGEAEKVVVDAISTKIINPKFMYDANGEYTEFYKNYIDQLEDLLNKYNETHEEIVKIGKLKRRINILKANMVDLFVGGIGTTDRMALRDSVEDAVLNCRSAAVDGVGYGANYEGLRVFNNLLKNYDRIYNDIKNQYKDDNSDEAIDKVKAARIDYEVATLIVHSYIELCSQIYIPYCDDDDKIAKDIVLFSLANEDAAKRKPYNILTEDFDGKVLSSIKTEPAILDSISRIITMLFNTNQFLVPDPRFNIYEMSEEDDIVKEKKEEVQKDIENIFGKPTATVSGNPVASPMTNQEKQETVTMMRAFADSAEYGNLPFQNKDIVNAFKNNKKALFDNGKTLSDNIIDAETTEVDAVESKDKPDGISTDKTEE